MPVVDSKTQIALKNILFATDFSLLPIVSTGTQAFGLSGLETIRSGRSLLQTP